MITAERKPMDEIMESIDGCSRILLVGCNECVTVCAAGGRKEVGLLASALQMASMKKGRTWSQGDDPGAAVRPGICGRTHAP
jgi:hypothetical protein